MIDPHTAVAMGVADKISLKETIRKDIMNIPNFLTWSKKSPMEKTYQKKKKVNL